MGIIRNILETAGCIILYGPVLTAPIVVPSLIILNTLTGIPGEPGIFMKSREPIITTIEETERQRQKKEISKTLERYFEKSSLDTDSDYTLKVQIDDGRISGAYITNKEGKALETVIE